jgi:signal transduction histidine kinase
VTTVPAPPRLALRVRPSARAPSGSAPAVRRHAMRVALIATLLVAVAYVLACLTIDLLVTVRFRHDLDERLAERLEALGRGSSRGALSLPGAAGAPLQRSAASGGEVDDVPVLAWWVPFGRSQASPLTSATPPLPRAERGVIGPRDASFAGRSFRLAGAAVDGGRLVVASSTAPVTQRLDTLLVAEAALAPVALAGFFVAALVIGRGAAAPIEEARRRQLRFVADASHELRTPLSVIEAEVGMGLSRRRDQGSDRAALERVAGESGRLRRIVDDLLWLARMDAEPGPPAGDVVDVVSVVDACAKRFEAVAERLQVSLSVEVASDDALVLAPAEWLDRLASVLLDNACRYSGPGGRVVASVAGDDGRVALTVDDTGPGIPAAERERIFERFHRASTVTGGAGLGLAIADSVVRATRGRWEVGESPRGGARLRVWWPRVSAGEG